MKSIVGQEISVGNRHTSCVYQIGWGEQLPSPQPLSHQGRGAFRLIWGRLQVNGTAMFHFIKWVKRCGPQDLVYIKS
jgi:hypothetical protein